MQQPYSARAGPRPRRGNVRARDGWVGTVGLLARLAPLGSCWVLELSQPAYSRAGLCSGAHRRLSPRRRLGPPRLHSLPWRSILPTRTTLCGVAGIDALFPVDPDPGSASRPLGPELYLRDVERAERAGAGVVDCISRIADAFARPRWSRLSLHPRISRFRSSTRSWAGSAG